MDVTRKYYTKCRKSEEIQKYARNELLNTPGERGREFFQAYIGRECLCPKCNSNLESGDYCKLCGIKGKTKTKLFFDRGSAVVFREYDDIWLPTFQQLFDNFIKMEATDFINDFYVFINQTKKKFYTFEDMALEYVMRKKYNKKWDSRNKKWVEIS